MNKKRIEITVDLDTGEMRVEAFGYPGGSCHAALDALVRAGGRQERRVLKTDGGTGRKARKGVVQKIPGKEQEP